MARRNSITKTCPPEQFTDRWASQIYKTVQQFKTTGQDIAGAAKNSAAILAESGWSSQQMLGTWGTLIGGGISGEEVGTAMKNLAQNADGLAKVAIAADEKAQALIAKHGSGAKKALEAQYGKQAWELFRKGPDTYFKALAHQIKKLEKQGKDVKPVLKEAFGGDLTNALLVLKSKADGLKGSIEAVGNATKREMLDRAADMNKGIGPVLDLLGQRFTWLRQKLGAVFEPSVVSGIDWFGRKFLQMADWVEARQEKLKASFSAFTGGFKAGFKEMFGGIPGASEKMQRLVTLLDTPDPSKWQQIGREIGQIAGLSFDGLVNGLRVVGQILSMVGTAAEKVWAAIQKISSIGSGIYNLGMKVLPEPVRNYLRQFDVLSGTSLGGCPCREDRRSANGDQDNRMGPGRKSIKI